MFRLVIHSKVRLGPITIPFKNLTMRQGSIGGFAYDFNDKNLGKCGSQHFEARKGGLV